MTYERRFQVLDYVFEVQTPRVELADLVEFVARDIDQPWNPRWTVSFKVRLAGDAYDLFEGDEELARGVWAGAVVEMIQLRITQIVFSRLSEEGWLGVHAGVADVDGRRVLVTGDKSSGKTSFLSRLLFDGAEVQGDDVTLVGAGSVLPFPRRFHLKEGIDEVVPELTGVLPDLPTLHYGEFRVWAWEPPQPRRVAWAPVDVVVRVEPSPDHRSRIVAVPSFRVVQHMMAHLMIVPKGRAWIADVCNVVGGALCFGLALGDLGEAADLLRESLRQGERIWEHV